MAYKIFLTAAIFAFLSTCLIGSIGGELDSKFKIFLLILALASYATFIVSLLFIVWGY